MIHQLDYLRQLNMASLVFRLGIAMLSGGFLGMERERHRRPAGFRTYMMVCLGAALTTILSQYEFIMITTRWAELSSQIGIKTDVSRFGAQVINGIGFIGAGTVIVTGRQEVKGLTTAAGLWASACMGLAVGAGFYECVAIGFVLSFLSMKFFPILETAAIENSRNMNMYAEFVSVENVSEIIALIKSHGIQIYDVELNRGEKGTLQGPSATFYIRLPKQKPHIEIISAISELENVTTIEEI